MKNSVMTTMAGFAIARFTPAQWITATTLNVGRCKMSIGR